ncbi:GGDEF domain-containing protein [Botrimarina sp.]|uniref:GGDEF domain-containing protein n=1 Tax=Botrimarina sp. TaxID=2795802 RepID=UPI0032F0690B
MPPSLDCSPIAAEAANLARTPLALATLSGGRLWCNQSFIEAAASLGVSTDELVGLLVSDPKRLGPNAAAQRVSLPEHGQAWLLEFTPRPAPGAAGEPQTDALTAVLSRAALMHTLDRWFANRVAEPFALAFLDLDDFKLVNDRHGHLVGDACLAEVGGRLLRATRGGDVVGRFGGDEFVVLLAGVTQPAQCEPIRRRLTEGVRAPLACHDAAGPLGVSIGVAFSGDSFDTPQAMISAADAAMYRDKRGSDRVRAGQ